jgi:hypothetical protein
MKTRIRPTMKKTFLTLVTLAALPSPAVAAENMAEYIKTPEGFYTMLGSMMYASETCGFPLPEKLIDAFAANAGVTKKMVVDQGGPAMREAMAMSKAATEKVGVETWCAEQRAGVEKLHEKGW